MDQWSSPISHSDVTFGIRYLGAQEMQMSISVLVQFKLPRGFNVYRSGSDFQAALSPCLLYLSFLSKSMSRPSSFVKL